MGIWEWVYSATGAIKQQIPDVTPVTDVCHKSYSYCRDSTISVALEAQVYLTDDQVRDYFGRFAKNGAFYVARSYGGGPIIDIVSRSVQEKKSDPHKKRIDELETKVAKLEKELSCMKMLEQSDIPRAMAMAKSEEELKQRLANVVNLFMVQQFVGTKLFDDLMIPVSAESKKKNMPPV